jgi:hypothetical protein
LATQKKTDNADPRAKLDLRRYFLRKYHAQPPHVLDCCQGDGLLWQTLRREFTLSSYWGLDLKPKKGRLTIDSVRVLALPGRPHDVIDVDTYGSPWKHWKAILPQVDRPTTVFLTMGQVSMGVDRTIFGHLGLGDLQPPPGIARKLVSAALRYSLADAYRHGLRLVEAVEALPAHPGSARYFGVRLEPV